MNLVSSGAAGWLQAKVVSRRGPSGNHEPLGSTFVVIALIALAQGIDPLLELLSGHDSLLDENLGQRVEDQPG